MEVINKFWMAIGKMFEWASTEEPFIVGMTLVGVAVTLIAVYMMMAYIVPAVVSAAINKAINKLRRTKFVRKMDRFYLLRKEYGKSHRDGSR